MDRLEDQGFVLSLRDYEANYTTQRDVRVLVSAARGVSVGQARAVIEQTTAAIPNASVNDRAGYVAEIKSTVDVVLAFVAIRLGLAVLIDVLGILNTLALSIVRAHAGVAAAALPARRAARLDVLAAVAHEERQIAVVRCSVARAQ